MRSKVFCLTIVLLPTFVACAPNDAGGSNAGTTTSTSTSVNSSTGAPSGTPSSPATPVAPGSTSGAPHTNTPPTNAPPTNATSSGISSSSTTATDGEQTPAAPSEEPSDAVTSSNVGLVDTGSSAEASSGVGSDVPTSEVSTDDGELTPLKVYVAGDSTVSTYRDTESTTDQAGWGQMLHEYLSELAVVDNRAVGGTTSRSYIDFGHFDEIAADIAIGDTLLVQFGTNDGNKTATYDLDGQEIPYYLDPATDYKTYLTKYIDLAEEKGANLIFVTPPPRNSAYCTGGNGTGGHAQAMRELAADRDVPLADLNMRSVDYLKAICPSPTPEDFFLLRGDGSVDGTHFQENGARHLAAFVAEGIAVAGAPLSRYVIDVGQ
jgi:lysophospholipase L1-like esterase